MLSWHLCILIISHSNALRLAKETPKSCTVTFAPHSGFGNQFFGALGAGYIAKIAGCKLQMPPVLGHGKKNGGIPYGEENFCLKGISHEKEMLSQAQKSGRKSKLAYNQIFEYTSLVSKEPSNPEKISFLPVHCKLWKEKGEDAKQYGDYLKEFIQKSNPVGAYGIGSGYNTGAPRLHISELFQAFSVPLEKGVSDSKDKMASITGTDANHYACLHLRLGDKKQIKVKNHPLSQWVSKHFADSKKPLLIASADLDKNVQAVLQDVCSKTKCIHSREIIPQENYGFQEKDKIMLIELALCSRAEDIYLPHADHKLLNGEFVDAPADAAVFRSTFSDAISEMALWHTNTTHENTNHPWHRPLADNEKKAVPLR